AASVGEDRRGAGATARVGRGVAGATCAGGAGIRRHAGGAARAEGAEPGSGGSAADAGGEGVLGAANPTTASAVRRSRLTPGSTARVASPARRFGVRRFNVAFFAGEHTSGKKRKRR